jgi:hypothetical protein
VKSIKLPPELKENTSATDEELVGDEVPIVICRSVPALLFPQKVTSHADGVSEQMGS